MEIESKFRLKIKTHEWILITLFIGFVALLMNGKLETAIELLKQVIP